MREPSATSPFAALTPQEQRHRWTVWQAQQQQPATPVKEQPEQAEAETEQNRPERKQTDVCPLSADLPVKPQEQPPIPQPQPLKSAIRHSQYDAVIKRMINASRQASQFSAVPGAGSTMQPSSGKP